MAPGLNPLRWQRKHGSAKRSTLPSFKAQRPRPPNTSQPESQRVCGPLRTGQCAELKAPARGSGAVVRALRHARCAGAHVLPQTLACILHPPRPRPSSVGLGRRYSCASGGRCTHATTAGSDKEKLCWCPLKFDSYLARAPEALVLGAEPGNIGIPCVLAL